MISASPSFWQVIPRAPAAIRLVAESLSAFYVAFNLVEIDDGTGSTEITHY